MSDITQPPPKPGQQDVTTFVRNALAERAERGRRKYGTSLQTWNGRDPYADAIEEELDRLQYLTQARLERADLIQAIRDAVALMPSPSHVGNGSARAHFETGLARLQDALRATDCRK